MGGNRGEALHTTMGTKTDGEIAWRGTTFTEGGIRGFDVSASTLLGFDLAGQLIGEREESDNSKILGRPGTANVYDSQARASIAVGGRGGNSTPGSDSHLFRPIEYTSADQRVGSTATLFIRGVFMGQGM